MPELYSNQVKLNAASQPRASAPKMDDSLGRAMSNLAATADNIAGTIQHIQDVELNAKVQAKAKEALSYLENADDPNADYTTYAAKAKEIYSSAFEGASEGALVRFNRSHPDNDLLFSGAADEIIFKKANSQIFNRVKNDMNEWTSNVALGLMSEKELNNIISNMPYLTSEQKDALSSSANHDVEAAKINFAIAGGRYDLARDLLENVRKTPNIGSDERLRMMSNLENTIVTAQNKISGQKDKTEKDQKEFISNYIGYVKEYYGASAAKEEMSKIATGEIKEINYGGLKLDLLDVAPLVKEQAINAAESGLYWKDSDTLRATANAKIKADQMEKALDSAKYLSVPDALKLREDVEANLTNDVLANATDEQKAKFAYSSHAFETKVLEQFKGVTSLGQKEWYSTVGGDKLAFVPRADLSLAVAGNIGAIPKEDMQKISERLMSGGELVPAFQLATDRLDNVFTGDLKIKEGTFGQLAVYLYGSYASMDPRVSNLTGLVQNPDAYTTALKDVVKYLSANDLWDKPVNEGSDTVDAAAVWKNINDIYIKRANGFSPDMYSAEQQQEQRKIFQTAFSAVGHGGYKFTDMLRDVNYIGSSIGFYLGNPLNPRRDKLKNQDEFYNTNYSDMYE